MDLSVNIQIQNRSTTLFAHVNGEWTEDRSEAATFTEADAALQFVHKQNLCNAQLVILNANGGLIVPVRYDRLAA